jgi:hypothetical protein
MTTEIKQYLRPEVLERLELKFERLRVRTAMKKALRSLRGENLSNTGRLCRVWDAPVIEPQPGEIERRLYG